MTRSDKWRKRPCVVRYWAFKDEVKKAGITIPDGGATIIFTLPMPASLSAKKKAALNGKPHQKRPDVDNICKGIFDCIFKEDSHIWDVRIIKFWGYEGSIEIK